MWCRHCQQDVAARPRPETQLLECSKCHAAIPRSPRRETTTGPKKSSHELSQPMSFRWRLDAAHAFAHEQAADESHATPAASETDAQLLINELETTQRQLGAEIHTSINLAWGIALLFVLFTVVAGVGVAIGQTHHAMLVMIIAQSLCAFMLVTWAYWKSQGLRARAATEQATEPLIQSHHEPSVPPLAGGGGSRRRSSDPRTSTSRHST